MAFGYHAVGVSGVLLQGDSVLLVQAAEGGLKGRWMLPGGFVESGESPEEAVVREVREETGLPVRPGALLGLRSGVSLEGETSLYLAFGLERLDGLGPAPHPEDPAEIAAAAFWPVAAALADPGVLEVTQAFIRSALASAGGRGGLTRAAEPIRTQRPYRAYTVYSHHSRGIYTD